MPAPAPSGFGTIVHSIAVPINSPGGIASGGVLVRGIPIISIAADDGNFTVGSPSDL